VFRKFYYNKRLDIYYCSACHTGQKMEEFMLPLEKYLINSQNMQKLEQFMKGDAKLHREKIPTFGRFLAIFLSFLILTLLLYKFLKLVYIQIS
jgi:cytochrome b subunit of formate dehydrogenase